MYMDIANRETIFGRNYVYEFFTVAKRARESTFISRK